MKRYVVLTMAAVAVLACLPAAADVIYDNGDQDYYVWLSGRGTRVYDDFQLAADAILMDVHWEGGAYYPYTPESDTFAIAIFEDNEGLPGTLVHEYTGVSPTRVASAGGAAIYEYSADVAPINLSAGPTYWISIRHEDPDLWWGWSTSNDDAGNAWQLIDGWRWLATESEFAFTLTGESAVVPEPATMTLLGLGIAALGWRRVRRSRA